MAEVSIAVARHTRAWIETPGFMSKPADMMLSPVTHGRGLKRNALRQADRADASPVTHGRGLKLILWLERCDTYTSPVTHGRGLKRTRCHPVRPRRWSPVTHGRGLKLDRRADPHVCRRSPVTHGRGLKLSRLTVGDWHPDVARHTRAWIETYCSCERAFDPRVARHTRAWIETSRKHTRESRRASRPSHTGVD